ncbi:hypothetical protein [Afifella pfennigii]|uniref:hypothetical protein n=1 Tax=Afifella pfennigii TaxID=209897 RepID=UPI00068A7B23|nr:hypothetical protein [Afifella pfennigii]
MGAEREQRTRAGDAAGGDIREPVGVTEKVAFLSQPAAYHRRPEKVEVVETHWSWVFLAGDWVYKLKKPVASQRFDFTTLAGREENCRKEVALNRRLAGEIYDGVARLTREVDGHLAIDGEGEIVDVLVVMRRLPEASMLDRLIARRELSPRMVTRLAARLAGFYADQPPVPLAPAAYRERFGRELASDRAVFSAFHDGIATPHLLLAERMHEALLAKGALLEERARAGRIVEGHGDLRPEHVCMAEPIVIFDCLEFSDELRQVDSLDEIVFLGLECAMLGADWVAPQLLDEVQARLGVPASGELVCLYTAARALLRARLCLSHLLDPVPAAPDRWPPLAARYAAKADEALARLGV